LEPGLDALMVLLRLARRARIHCRYQQNAAVAPPTVLA
jgi:hypothetical protein